MADLVSVCTMPWDIIIMWDISHCLLSLTTIGGIEWEHYVRPHLHLKDTKMKQKIFFYSFGLITIQLFNWGVAEIVI